MVWRGEMWLDRVRSGEMRQLWRGRVWYGVAWQGLVWCDMVS